MPTIKDRVVQTAAMLVIEPIFEADLQPEQHGYRPRRSAQDAVQAVHALIKAGHRVVVDADLSGYFDSIPRKELMQSVARRICDRQMLKLIKMWLHTPVVEDSKKGKDEPKGGGEKGNPTRVSDLTPFSQPVLSSLHNGVEETGTEAVSGQDCVLCGRLCDLAVKAKQGRLCKQRGRYWGVWA